MENNYNQVMLQEGISVFFTRVYALMFLALLITFGVTAGVYTGIVYNNPIAVQIGMFLMEFYYFVIGFELVLVMLLSARIQKMSMFTAVTMFIIYSITNGLVFSIILPYYSNIGIALGMTSVTFLVMTVYGLITKKDLSGVGSFLTVTLISVVIATLVNMFLQSAMIDYIVCYVGLFLFIALTAYDTNKLKNIYLNRANIDNATLSKLVVMGALSLYLDFINMFMYILRIMNRVNR